MQLIENIGRMVLEKRAGMGVRGAAKEIGISHATLSRVERGFLPDVLTYQKICEWLGEPLLAVAPVESSDVAEVHFRKAPTISPKTAEALAKMILFAQKELMKHPQV